MLYYTINGKIEILKKQDKKDCAMADKRTYGEFAIKNDNLNITFSIGGYTISILKFSYECLTWNTPSHAHSSNSYEIHYIPRGKGTLVSNQKSYDLYPNVLYTTGPNIDHAQFSDPDNPMFEYCIYLKVEKEAKSQHNNELKHAAILKQFTDYPFWYDTDRTNLPSVLQQIYLELTEPGPAASFMVQSLFMQFMVNMLRNYDQSSKAAIASIPIPLVKAYILIEDSFLYEYGTITMEELSNRLGLSVRQTSRILYNRYGQNFIQKRTEARMAAAATFLQENKLYITEISQKLGYSCPNHFHAAFKNYYHLTASQYRSTYRQSS